MRVAVIGAGAVGLALGSCLAAAGERPRFVVRDEATARLLESKGLRRSGIFGEQRAEPDAIEVCRSIPALARDPIVSIDPIKPINLILVCTKTHDSKAVAEALAAAWPELPGEPRVVLCQNGWGNAELFARHLPRERIYSARVITGFRRTAPNAVEVTVHADAIHVGSLFDADLAPVEELCRAIAVGGIPCAPSREIAKDLWAKVLYNCLLNPLGALVGVPYGVLGEREETRAIMQAVAGEVFAVMAGAGFETHWPTADVYLESFYAELLPATALHESSMLQDLRAGRRTEIDAISGAVAQLAAQHGMPAPLNGALATLIRGAETRKERG
ncbi:MAG: ketopantoate reductase family protein [Deltaproteobacteria bacterium]|nr:ketopantoate reductase family protein [Deltaproteobacteria bacterium]MBW2418544.1 ketopantoate reductase family protein [Deltaproteobacteria bacterium]